MLTIRKFEERCLALSSEGLIAGSIHLCAGQEAVPVGALAALTPEDRIVATYRGHGWAIACGVPLTSLLAEICHRATGVNGGRAGSAYLTAPQYGLVGENSIVGAGVPIATGTALASQYTEAGRVAVVSIGDGATSQGATHEGLVTAVYKKLPLVIVCENNGWSEMTPISTIVKAERLADRAAAYGMPAITIDGCDPAAVSNAIAEAAARARAADGPTFVECRTVRLMGHYNRDIEHYRSKEEISSAREADPLLRLRARLLHDGECSENEVRQIEESVAAEIEEAAEAALAAPLPDPASAHEHVVGPVQPPRGVASSEQRELTYAQAVNEALRAELEERPNVLVFGEDVGRAGGIFGVTRNLQKTFGEERVFDMPIAESAILGMALGAALEGLRPIAEIMWSDFLLVALDQLINQAANVRYLSLGTQSAPLVVRTQQGVTPGSCAQHSQSLEALLAHVPGLRVGLPATPQDAYGMLRAAVADDDPCVIIESRALYQERGFVALGADETVGGAALRRQGRDVGLITWGQMLHPTLEAAELLATRGVDAAVLDLRWVAPLDEEAVSALVHECGRVVVVHEANITGGFGAEVAARIAGNYLDALDAPVRRLGAPDVRFPAAPGLQAALLPSRETIAAAAHEIVTAG